MRLKNLFLLAIPAAVVLLSCASTPDVEETVFPPPEAERARAEDLRERIAEYGLDQLAEADFEAAEMRYAEGIAAYDQDNEASKAAFDGAIVYYEDVVEKGFSLLTDGRKTGADSSLALADGIKAAVAVKEDYEAARAVYDDAVAARGAAEYEEAMELFEQADRLLREVYEKAKEKKDAAEQAIQEALDSMASSEEKAREAEETMEQ